jgi:MerR family transcriptional regulator/heat shock protein HspR
MTDSKTKPLYMIGVVGEMLKLHPQTLRMYEKKGLIRPSRTEGRRACTPPRTSRRSRGWSA